MTPSPDRDESVYLQDILEHARLILVFTQGLDEAAFYQDQKTFYAVTRCFEVMGEAAKKLSAETKAQMLEIPWRKVAGFRDVLIHEYHGVQAERVWHTLQEHLPLLIQQLEFYFEQNP